MERLWFKRKSYGFGWTPASPEGWFVTIAAILLIIWFSFDAKRNPTQSMAYILLTVIVLLVISYKTGEKPRWQWGNKDKKRKSSDDKQ